jgi:hypothetical protein
MGYRRILGATGVLAASVLVAVAPAQPAGAAAAPSAINARAFTLTTDMSGLADEVAALDAALGAGRRRTVGQVMEAANRERVGLCNATAYSSVSARGTVQGFCWNDGDDAVDYWYPQGLTTSRDAYEAGEYDGHQIVLTSWYHIPANESATAPNKGARLSFVDWDADWPNTYRHVLLVEPTAGGNFRSVPVHAGGIMWYGNLLYVADTWNGFRVFDFARLYGVNTGDGAKVGRQADGTFHAFDYAYVMVQVGWLRNAGASFRHSFVSLDRATTPDSLIVGEYSTDSDGNGVPDSNARVLRYPLDYTDRLPVQEADGRTYGSEAYDTHIPQMQGALARGSRFWFASSNGSQAGYLRVWDRGTTAVRSYRWAVGPEDLSYYAHPDQADLIWTLTEHPNRRTVIAVPQADWD